MISKSHKDKTWKQVRKFWRYPQLNEPEFTSKEGMENEIAAIDMKKRRILVNEKNLEDKLGPGLLRPVESHEVGHYKFCPYSLKNLVKLIAVANKELNNLPQAKMVENLFADLMVNYHLYKNGETGIANVYEKLSQGHEQSKLWDFYMQTFAGMLGKNIRKTILAEDERADAKKLGEILKESAYKSKQWPSSIKEFSNPTEKKVF